MLSLLLIQTSLKLKAKAQNDYIKEKNDNSCIWSVNNKDNLLQKKRYFLSSFADETFNYSEKNIWIFRNSHTLLQNEIGARLCDHIAGKILNATKSTSIYENPNFI